MSSHHSIKWFLTHWGQERRAKERRAAVKQERQDRHEAYAVEQKTAAAYNQQVILIMVVIWFVSVSIISLVYMSYILAGY